MKLYQFAYSPHAAKVRKVRELKHLAFECIEVLYLDRQEAVRLTNQVVVPILVDGDLAIADSPAITAYSRPTSTSATPRISVRVLPHRSRVGLIRSSKTSRFGSRRRRSNRRSPSSTVVGTMRAMYRFVKERKFGPGCIDAWARDQKLLVGKLRALVASLAPAPYVLGSEPSLADAAIWGSFYMLEWAMPGWVAREVPHLADWYQRLAAR